MTIKLLIAVQVLTFLGLGVCFLMAGQYRLGVCQLLLAAVQGILYTGRMGA